MNILISDYKDVMQKEYVLTEKSIRNILPDAKIEVIPYEDTTFFWNKLKQADGLISAFLNIDEAFLQKAKQLKVISLSSVGYASVDLVQAQKCKVNVCHIREYCTQEVAEHAIALMFTLNRNIKYYQNEIEQKKQWAYHSVKPQKTIAGQTIAIFGFGKIGKQVARMAGNLGMRVLVVDPYFKQDDLGKPFFEVVSAKEAFQKADVITNHMNLTNENMGFFEEEAFRSMERKPIFLNLGRGKSVKESALIEALDKGYISGAGLDVLEEEDPKLENHPLLHRTNVVLTPHSAFYSKDSIQKLEVISGENLAYFLKNQKDKVDEIVI